ncbi:hypothetical protein MRB53_041155 [Persea americana]|nr:hypothetical protein MRB53_041155 [Persea americana]
MIETVSSIETIVEVKSSCAGKVAVPDFQVQSAVSRVQDRQAAFRHWERCVSHTDLRLRRLRSRAWLHVFRDQTSSLSPYSGGSTSTA